MSRIFITGGLGCIGSLMARRLHGEGHNIAIIDACESPRNEWTASRLTGVTIFRERLERYAEIVDRVQQADAIIHCAAHTGIPHSITDPIDDWVSNVDATRALLDALSFYPRPTVIFSSVKPYQTIPMPEAGLNENVALSADEPYAASKASQSLLCQAYSRSYDLPIVVYRFSNLFGPAPSHGPRHNWVTWFSVAAAIGVPIEVQGSGGQTRDILHFDDIYTACMLGLRHIEKLKGEIFNVGGGRKNRVAVNFVANLIQEKTGATIVAGPARAMDDEHVFVDHSKFTAATGWTPAVGSIEGIKDVLAWAIANKNELAMLYGAPHKDA